MLQQYTRLLLNKHQLDTVVKRTITVIYCYDLPSFLNIILFFFMMHFFAAATYTSERLVV